MLLPSAGLPLGLRARRPGLTDVARRSGPPYPPSNPLSLASPCSSAAPLATFMSTCSIALTQRNVREDRGWGRGARNGVGAVVGNRPNRKAVSAEPHCRWAAMRPSPPRAMPDSECCTAPPACHRQWVLLPAAVRLRSVRSGYPFVAGTGCAE